MERRRPVTRDENSPLSSENNPPSSPTRPGVAVLRHPGSCQRGVEYRERRSGGDALGWVQVRDGFRLQGESRPLLEQGPEDAGVARELLADDVLVRVFRRQGPRAN